MTFQGDPYRMLGVAPGASLNEIRSAYRRLAKQYHPDAAGERALPRFLAIQAAYEQLVDGEGRLRSTRRGGTARTTRSAGGAEPWRADPARARASRDAWRARWARTEPAGQGSTGEPRGRGPAGEAAAGPAKGAPRGSEAGSDESRSPGGRPPGERRHHARSGHRRATPGSTTYDEARETPRDPTWDGGAWYGPTSGTYWTLNPREYADPRKHGPEYLARARRASGDHATGGSAGPGAPDPAAPDPDPGSRATSAGTTGFHAPSSTSGDPAPGPAGAWEWTGTARTTTGGDGAEWQARRWSYDTRPPGADWTPGPEADRVPGDRRAGSGALPPDVAPPLPDLETLVRLAFPEHLHELAQRDDRRWRLVLALLAWPPIGWVAGSLVSSITGCASFSAACPDTVPILLLLAQPLIIAALYALPAAVAVGAFASLAALVVAIPAGTVLSVGALPRPTVEPAVLGVIVGVAYATALVAAAVRLRRSPRADDPAP
jgi:curved DNA-binding protein CbpA